MINGIRSVRFLVAVSFIVVVGGAVYLLSSSSRESAGSGADAEAVPLVQVRRTSLPEKLILAGKLQPKTQVEVVSRLAGKLAEVRFKVGDFVPAGALVAIVHANELDQRLARLAGNVDEAKQALRSGEEELTKAEKNLAQRREYFRKDLIARREIEQAEIAVETARAKAELARAQLAQQEAMLDQVRKLQSLTRLYAPAGGQVVERLVEPGAVIGEGAGVLSIANLDILKINLNLSAEAVSRLRRERDVEITSPERPGVIAKGKVIRVALPTDDPGKSGEVEIELNNPERRLHPGMAVAVSVDLPGAGEVLLVPRSALGSGTQESYVYRVLGGRAVRQPVVLGLGQGEQVTVIKGLEEGDWIVADPTKVQSGTRIRLN